MLIRTLLLFTVTVFCSLQASATTVLPMSLQQMTASAELIFYGTATSNEVRLDASSGRVATFTTFDVIDVIKGTVGDMLTIKQVGGQLADSRFRQIIHGVPRFSVGAEYVVFLPAASSLGFSSPIGLSQGRFSVVQHNGERVVSNGRPVAAMLEATTATNLGNTPQAGLISAVPTLSAVPDEPASASLPEFLRAIRGMTKE
jgi:hypothetical protein